MNKREKEREFNHFLKFNWGLICGIREEKYDRSDLLENLLQNLFYLFVLLANTLFILSVKILNGSVILKHFLYYLAIKISSTNVLAPEIIFVNSRAKNASMYDILARRLWVLHWTHSTVKHIIRNEKTG